MPGIDPRISVVSLDRIHFGMKPALAQAITDAIGTDVASWSKLPQAELVRRLPDRVAWELCDALGKLDGDKVVLGARAEAAARRRKVPLNAMESAEPKWWQEKQPHGQRIRPYERLKIDKFRIVYKGPAIRGAPTGPRGGLGRGNQEGRVLGKAILENGQPVDYANTPENALAKLRKLEAKEPRVRGYLRVEKRSDLHEPPGVERGMQPQVSRRNPVDSRGGYSRAAPDRDRWAARRIIEAQGYHTVEEAMEDLSDDRSHGGETYASAALQIWARLPRGQQLDRRPSAVEDYVARVLKLGRHLDREA